MKKITKFYRFFRSYWKRGPIGEIAARGNSDLTLLAIYLLTSPRSNMVGIYHIDERNISKALGIGLERVTGLLEELANIGFIKYDFEENYVWILSAAISESVCANDNQVKGLFNLIDLLEFDECAPFTEEARQLLHEHLVARQNQTNPGVVELQEELNRRAAMGR